MEPAIWIGDRVLVDKLSFHLTGLHRGDVVVVAMSQPQSQSQQLIKRVVGLPGDRIECRADAVYRNGVPVPGAAAGAGACDPVTVPAGSMYLLGDHVQVSVDSRRLGPVAQSTVVGRVVGRVRPLSGRSAADAS
jgi:signal peptidase I